MNIFTQIFISGFVLINLLAFGILWVDKIRSRRNNDKRISEGMMFFLATLFGSVGIFIGMFVFRHKTRKWYFLVGIPLLFFENLATLVVCFQLLQ
jgi:uncharacterized membrane protein YsdA (DUF1294 family)